LAFISKRIWKNKSMLFPISDDDRHLLKPAWVTILILLANIAVYIYQVITPAFTTGWSAVPYEILSGIDLVGAYQVISGNPDSVIELTRSPTPVQLTLISSMFMHGSLMHLGGNMLYLWIFGDNLEHRYGGRRFLFFYLASGLAGTLAHIALAPESIIPMLGASGAISGILGAYIVLFPWNQVNAVFFFRIISLPAIVVIGIWAITQFLAGWGTLGGIGQSGGVAYSAHIGGFIAGAIVGLASRARMKEEPDNVLRRKSQIDPHARRLW
jgi:membrane associated rhomboid family serine protease